MKMMTVFFLIVVGILIVASIRRAGTIFNVFAILATPYFFIMLINASVAHPFFGFFSISDDVLLMILSALFAFFIGSVPFSKPSQSADRLTIDEKFNLYDIKAMSTVVLMVGVLSFGRVVYVFATGGIDPSTFDDSTGALGAGIIGHLNLFAESLLPIVMLYGIRRRDIKALIGSVLVALAVFSTFVKYNIICLVISVALFFALNEKQLAKRAVVVILIASVVLFVTNYYIGFAFRGVSSDVSRSFYFNHLWAYIGGSTIYDNYIFTIGIRVGIGTIEKLMTFICALPNMFLGKVLGVRLFAHVRQEPMYVSSSGVQSNVVDAIGYLFPSQGSALEVALFLFVMLYIGFLFSAFVSFLSDRSKLRFNTVLPFFLTEFVLMSFFGTFYINSGPWEQLVWCAVVPNLFLVDQSARTASERALLYREKASFTSSRPPFSRRKSIVGDFHD